MEPWVEAKQRLPLPVLVRKLCTELSGKSDRQLKCVSSPLRGDDKKPSFSVYNGKDGKWRWKDHGIGKKGDEIDFLCELKGLDNKEALQYYYNLAGVEIKKKEHSVPPIQKKTYNPKEYWPNKLQRPTATNFKDIAKRSGLPTGGLRWADARGHLWITDYLHQKSYAITDRHFEALDLRPLHTRKLEAKNGEKRKVTTASGFKKQWLIGCDFAWHCDYWILCEGSHDFLAAYGLMVHYGEQHDTAVVAMPGKFNIPDECLGNMSGKDVTIMPHLDDGGMEQAEKWKEDLSGRGAVVRIADYQPTLDRLAQKKRTRDKRRKRRPKGFNDLRDLMRIPDWEQELAMDGVDRLIPEHYSPDPF